MVLIDGNIHATPYDEYELSTGEDGCHPPFYLFDTGSQEHFTGPIPDRESAHRLQSMLQPFATPDPYLSKEI